MTQPAAALSIAGEPISALGARRRHGSSPNFAFWRPTILIGIGAAAWGLVLVIDALHGVRLRAPHFRLLFEMPAILQLHVVTAILALAVGLALMVGVKGRTFHRVAGWTWVACMVTVAASSFWIRDHGRLSYIHLLSGWVSISVPMAVAAVQRRDVRRHRALMTNIFMGGLVVAGAFTFVPGRLMWRIFLG